MVTTHPIQYIWANIPCHVHTHMQVKTTNTSIGSALAHVAYFSPHPVNMFTVDGQHITRLTTSALTRICKKDS